MKRDRDEAGQNRTEMGWKSGARSEKASQGEGIVTDSTGRESVPSLRIRKETSKRSIDDRVRVQIHKGFPSYTKCWYAAILYDEIPLWALYRIVMTEGGLSEMHVVVLVECDA